jgi:hypothetical protein
MCRPLQVHQTELTDQSPLAVAGEHPRVLLIGAGSERALLTEGAASQ